MIFAAFLKRSKPPTSPSLQLCHTSCTVFVLKQELETTDRISDHAKPRRMKWGERKQENGAKREEELLTGELDGEARFADEVVTVELEREDVEGAVCVLG